MAFVERGSRPVKVLLDRCVPRRFGRLLAGHRVRTAFEMGWSGLNNGVLLAEARPQFDETPTQIVRVSVRPPS
jgi:hypothetical protein